MNYRGRFLIKFLDVDRIISDKISIDKMLDDYDNGNVIQLQDFIGTYLKNEDTWITCIGLIDAMDVIYNASKENGLI